MKTKILTTLGLFASILATAQVGINTTSPTRMLDVNGAPIRSIPASTSGDKVLVADSDGNVSKIVPTSITHNLSGDVKYSFQLADHDGWYVLDGRALTTLPAVAKSAAEDLGLSILPNAVDRTLKTKSTTEALVAVGGNNSLAISKENLPDLTLSGTISGTTSSGGAHSHTTGVGGAGFLLSGTTLSNNGGGGFIGTTNTNSWGGTGRSTVTNTQGNHTHTINGTATVPTGGSGTPVNNMMDYLVTNTFIYLGK